MSAVRANPKPAAPAASPACDFDLVIVGAGFGGLYMLHRARQRGLKVRLFEAAGGVGGTWWWNRYPGARVDIESFEYSFAFDDALQQEWQWSERYAAQPELLRYLNHVADRFGLRPDMQFDTRVNAARFDEAAGVWDLEVGDGQRVRTRYCAMATGLLSAPHKPPIPGLDTFKGEQYQTSYWPHHEVDFTGKRVAVIGTGSSAIQSIPVIARQAKHLTVFQRTPNFSIPLRNCPMDREIEKRIKADYKKWREMEFNSFGGFISVNYEPYGFNPKAALEVSAQERRAEYERRWASGGLCFYLAFTDLLFNREANETLAEFVREKIRERVKDPAVAELLVPQGYPILTKRLCADTGYYETFNRDNVTLVSIKDTPIEKITPTGIVVAGREYPVDAIVFATGFDAVTGALNKIDIRGRGGAALKDQWRNGPRTSVGIMSAGFPNLFFVNGPGSPAAFFQPVLLAEYQGDWILDCIGYLDRNGKRTIEATESAAEEFVKHSAEIAGSTLFGLSNNWYMGANIPGKTRVMLMYLGGFPAYRDQCVAAAANGYGKFVLDGTAAGQAVAA
ncbi:MAG: NAD(P)/FAD-dependent oxidoreductase [Nevskia sp.]|nr:NAD(P)/FAD-dependent oxidoreductase [Nevskia sp.]